MPKRLRRLAFVTAAVAGVMMIFAGPVTAADNQLSGVGVNDFGTRCKTALAPPYDGYFTAPPLAMTGSLTGCWYTKADPSTIKITPSGVYQERGEEVFFGSLNGGRTGSFTTTYHFEAKFDLSTGAEIKGRCQHPIAAGSGTGGLAGAVGRVDFKDDIVTGDFPYRGHIRLT